MSALTISDVERFFEVGPETLQKLAVYGHLLDTDARRIGLIGFSSEAIPEQLARSLLLGRLLLDGPILDVGSGAGFPGIPLTILASREATIVEPKRRAVAFLEKVVRELELDAKVFELSAEEAVGRAFSAPNVCARALAEPNRAMQMCLPLCAAGGRLILTSGPAASESVPAEMTVVDLDGPLDIVQRILMMNTSSPHHDPTDQSTSGMGPTST